jgi:Co/Zn/Cd efflux system component
MDVCCSTHPVHERQRRALRLVLWINAAMFLAELVAGVVAHSTALIADSVDMLGDAIAYGVSLYVVGREPRWLARGALLKGGIMAAFGTGVLVEIGTQLARGLTPEASIMWRVALVALLANGVVLAILWRLRDDDINMRSVWLCSRNDVIANGGVLLAAFGVHLTASAWPDILMGLAIAALFGTSAVAIIRQALAIHRGATGTAPPGPSRERAPHGDGPGRGIERPAEEHGVLNGGTSVGAAARPGFPGRAASARLRGS